MPCCVHPCHCVLSQPVASPHSRSATQNDQRSRSAENGDDSVPLRTWAFLAFFLWHGALATVWCTICWPDLPKVLRGCQCKSSSRYRVLCTLLTSFADRDPNPRKQRPYFDDPSSHIARQKHKVLRPGALSPVNPSASELLHFATAWWWVVDMVMRLTRWCGWHDGHDNRPYLGSFPTKLPLDCILPWVSKKSNFTHLSDLLFYSDLL